MDKEKHDSNCDVKKIVQIFNLNIDCCNKENKSVRPSAFRAVNNTAEQSVTADTLVRPVLYPDEIFDLNNEYEPVTSTFTPKQDGVYSIIASVNFASVDTINYRVLIYILINGNPVVVDNDFWGEIPFSDATSVSAILQLTAGDEVNVAAASSTNSELRGNPLIMHFEAARLPSPLINDPLSTGITYSSSFFSGGELIMSDNNTRDEIKGPIRITNREEYLKLKEENRKNNNVFINEGYKHIDNVKCLRHPLAYICDFIGGTVSVVDIVDAVKLMEIKVGDGALSIDISKKNNYAYVTNFFANTLSVINTADNKVVDTVLVGSSPAGVKVSKDGRFVYVVHYGEPFIYVLDAYKLEVVTKIPLPSPGFQIDITKGGSRAFVSLRNFAKAAVVDLNVNLVVKVIDTGSGAEDVKISPTSPLVFISNQSNNSVTPVNTKLAEPSTTNIGTGNSPVGLAFSTGGRKLYVANRFENNVSVIDVFSHSEITKIEVEIEPYGATATTSGRLVIVSNYLSNSLSIIDTKRDKVLSTAPTGVGPAFSAILERN